MQLTPDPQRGSRTQLVLGVVVVLLVGLLWWSGQLDRVDLGALRAVIERAGPWGPAVYLLGFVVLQPVGVSAHLFLVAGGLLFHPVLALPLSQAGLMGASVVSWGAGRMLSLERVRARLPERVRVVEGRLREGGVMPIIFTRIVFFSFFPLSLLMGALRIPLRHYLLGSFLGMMPLAVAEVLLADRFAVGLTGGG